MARRITGWSVMVLLMLFMVSLAFAGGPDLNPGKWEITSTVEMPGMPMKMPPITTTRCMTKDDMIFKEVPQPGMQQGGMPKECKMTRSEVKGDTVIWEMVCQGQQKMTYYGELTYHGDTMEGFIKMTSSAQGQGGGAAPPMTIKIKGKRIGPCDK